MAGSKGNTRQKGLVEESCSPHSNQEAEEEERSWGGKAPSVPNQAPLPHSTLSYELKKSSVQRMIQSPSKTPSLKRKLLGGIPGLNHNTTSVLLSWYKCGISVMIRTIAIDLTYIRSHLTRPAGQISTSFYKSNIIETQSTSLV